MSPNITKIEPQIRGIRGSGDCMKRDFNFFSGATGRGP